MNEPTKQIDDGGPAFPMPIEKDSEGVWHHAGDWQAYRGYSGMSLRAYLAGRAMQGMLANPEMRYDWSGLAQDSLFAADALIAELNKKPE